LLFGQLSEMKLINNITDLFGDDLKQTLSSGAHLKIAASCFSIYAFEALKDELEKIESFEFIFTSPIFIPNDSLDKLRKERREFYIPSPEREKSFYGSEFEIQLKNKLTQKAIAKECAEWIKRKSTFKSNISDLPMQQFACVEGASVDAAYVPLSGFTAVDLGYQKGNAVSSFVNKFDEAEQTRTYIELFSQLWSDDEKLEDVTQMLVNHISTVYKENSPESIYFFMLYNIFNEFLESLNEDFLPNDLTGYKDSQIWSKMFNFQRDAATGIINKLDKFNGCILADSVGLGKTFTALGVIKYYELRNKSVLVLCPKRLAENWKNFNSNYKTNPIPGDRLNFTVLNHTDLSREKGESYGIELDRFNWGNYDLVVIDESHNFRNIGTHKDKETRYDKLMNKVIRAGVKTKVLMLSATPVNNRFGDLKNQLALAYEGDSEQMSKHLNTSHSIEDIFKNAQRVFNEWSKLPAEKRTATAILNNLDFDFFELLDSVTIARSRKHIETYYDTTDIGKFPERLKPITKSPKLTNLDNVIGFNEIFESLRKLKLSVYAPITYILPSMLSKYEDLYDTEIEGGKSKFRQADREKSLQSLMTANLLKRLESSVHSFRLTLERLQSFHTETLSKINNFNNGKTKDDEISSVLADNDIDEDDEDLDNISESIIGGKVKISLADMDLLSWQHDLEIDLKGIEFLLSEMYKITPEYDSKLQDVKSQIDYKINHPTNINNKKVLVFTAFSDTVDYLYEHISTYIYSKHKLHIAKVSGSKNTTTAKGSYDFQSILTLFSPRSKDKAALMPNDVNEIDILIATDCISEGQNLQDCDYVINFDIHWNPVRIIQRFGRIDRIGSANKSIQLVNYWPDISLDEYINLKKRVENRMMILDVSGTGDDNVLTVEPNDVSYRKEQLMRLQDEVFNLEDLETGISISDLGLNDFRIDLLSYTKENNQLSSMPTGMHSVVFENSQLGLVPGVIFTLFNRNQSVNVNQQNRLHPYYLVYISNSGEVVARHTEVKLILDKTRRVCKGDKAPILEAYTLFNKKTLDGKNMTRYSELLDAAILSMISTQEEGDIDSLFSGGSTSALTNKIKGLNDFELISFLVVQELE
jgi:superfamily II DNA or RNA helicase